MILRQVSANANRRACWALIPQIEHARLAHDLAANWHGLPLDDRLLQEMILPTIAHHDDGWSAWDAAPQIDPTSGRPYSFLDMPHEESLKIWTKSIDAVESIGPLAQWLVAQHFSQLLASAPSSNESSAEESEPIAKQWIAEQAIKSEDWQARWQENYSTVGANNRAACVELAEQALLRVRRVPCRAPH